MPEGSTWYATFPNARGLGLTHSLREFSDFTRLLEMDNYCSLMLYSLLCFHYFPPCSPPNSSAFVVEPCQEVCREATEACLPIARAINGDAVSIPNHLDCANFAEYGQRRARYYYPGGRADNTATRSLSPNVVLACPNSCELKNIYLLISAALFQQFSSNFRHCCSYSCGFFAAIRPTGVWGIRGCWFSWSVPRAGKHRILWCKSHSSHFSLRASFNSPEKQHILRNG